MTIATTTRPSVTSSASFSWYLPPTHKLLTRSAELADALTIAGPKGPAAIHKVRDQGFNGAVLFDGLGYMGKDLPPLQTWVTEQRRANADRVLLPGVFVPWDKEDNSVLVRIVEEQTRIATDFDATVVLALDAHWVAKRVEVLTDLLRAGERPVAIVLAHRADPLSLGGAVAGLRWLAARVPHVSVLRCDHGALGAVAFGADHAAIGLSTSTRHFATSAMKPRRLPGSSARLFVRPLLDWFRASEVAGWSATGANITCRLPCCAGASLARFLDTDLDATWHTMNAIADFADFVLDAEPGDRSVEFLNECRSAAARYGLAGFKGPENPKAQLTGWALS
jgi:hypothetical protein